MLRARIGALEGARDRGFASVDGGEVDRWLGGGLARGRVHAVAGPAATAFAVVLCARLRGTDPLVCGRGRSLLVFLASIHLDWPISAWTPGGW